MRLPRESLAAVRALEIRLGLVGRNWLDQQRRLRHVVFSRSFSNDLSLLLPHVLLVLEVGLEVQVAFVAGLQGLIRAGKLILELLVAEVDVLAF